MPCDCKKLEEIPPGNRENQRLNRADCAVMTQRDRGEVFAGKLGRVYQIFHRELTEFALPIYTIVRCEFWPLK